MAKFPIVDNESEVRKYLKSIHAEKSPILLWQVVEGKNIVHYGVAHSYSEEERSLEIKPTGKTKFHFEGIGDIYFYCEAYQVCSSLEPVELKTEIIKFKAPKTVYLIRGDIFASMKIVEVETENEKEFLKLRNAQRKEASGGQMATIQKESGEILEVQLNDISTGGMGILVKDPGLFVKDDIVLVTHINTKPIEKQLKGVVVAIRKMPKSKFFFKVGVQFRS